MKLLNDTSVGLSHLDISHLSPSASSFFLYKARQSDPLVIKINCLFAFNIFLLFTYFLNGIRVHPQCSVFYFQ